MLPPGTPPAALVAAPVSGGNDSLCIESGSVLNLGWPLQSSGLLSAVLKLISAGAVKYTVQVLDVRQN